MEKAINTPQLYTDFTELYVLCLKPSAKLSGNPPTAGDYVMVPVDIMPMPRRPDNSTGKSLQPPPPPPPRKRGRPKAVHKPKNKRRKAEAQSDDEDGIDLNVEDVRMHCKVEYGANEESNGGSRPSTSREVPPSSNDDAATTSRPAETFVTKNLEFLNCGNVSYCIHCKALQEKWQYHTASQHRDKNSVAVILTERHYVRRQALWTALQNKCNHIHNVQVLKKGQGSLVVHCGRPALLAQRNCYVQCMRCYGYFGKADLDTHECPARVIAETEDAMPTAKRCDAEFLKKLPNRFNALMRNMPQEAATAAVKGDVTLREWVYQLFIECNQKEYGCQCHAESKQCPFVQRKVRHMMELLLRMRRSIGPDYLTLAQVLDVHYADVIVATARDVTDGVEADFRNLLFGVNTCARFCLAKLAKQGGAQGEAENFAKFLEVVVPEVVDY